MWVLGHVKHNEHWSETGFLAGEAALNSLVAVESFKYSLRRERRIRAMVAACSSKVVVLLFHRNTPLPHGQWRV